VRALELHPDKCSTLNCEKREVERKFCRLQRAKEILLDTDRRRDYDRWRQSGLHVSYRKWCNLNEGASGGGGLHTSIHWFGNRDRVPALLGSEQIENGADKRSSARVDQTIPTSCKQNPQLLFRRTTEHANSLLQQFRNYEI